MISTRQHLPRSRNNSELPNLMTILQCEFHPRCSVSGQWEDLGTFDSSDVRTTNTRPKMTPCYLEIIHVVKKMCRLNIITKQKQSTLGGILALLDCVRRPNVIALASVVIVVVIRPSVRCIFSQTVKQLMLKFGVTVAIYHNPQAMFFKILEFWILTISLFPLT